MSKSASTPEVYPEPAPRIAGADILADAIGGAVRDAINATKSRTKTTYAEAVAKNAPPVLPAPAFQNSKRVNPRGLSDATIQKLFQIPAGLYMAETVKVVRRLDAGIEIFYDNYSTIDTRVGFMMKVSSFTDLVNKLHAEAQLKAQK